MHLGGEGQLETLNGIDFSEGEYLVLYEKTVTKTKRNWKMHLLDQLFRGNLLGSLRVKSISLPQVASPYA